MPKQSANGKDQGHPKTLGGGKCICATTNQGAEEIQLDLLDLCAPAGGAPSPTTSTDAVIAAAAKPATTQRSSAPCPPSGLNPSKLPQTKTLPSQAGASAPNGRAREAGPTNGPLYLGVVNVARRYDVSVASIWRWVAAGKFPRPRKLASGTTRWSIADLDTHERTLG